MTKKQFAEKYVVRNRYGIGCAGRMGRKDEIVFTPRSVGRKSAEACEAWIKKNDTANTCEIVLSQ